MVARCTFCSIIAGDANAFVVLDSGDALGFLDVRPLFPGHVLVVPRQHYETLTDLPPGAVGPFFVQVRAVAAAVESACHAQGTFVAVNNRVSQSVPHLHAHVVPRTKGDGLRGFFWPRARYHGDDHARQVAAAIRQELAAPTPPA